MNIQTIPRLRAALIYSAVILAVLAGVLPGHAAPPNFESRRQRVGGVAPAFEAVDQYGRRIRVEDLTGSWVAIHFVGTWSERCVELAADTQPLTDLLRANRVPFVALTVVMQDQQEQNATARTALDWALQHGITEPVLSPRGLAPGDSEVWRQFSDYVATPGGDYDAGGTDTGATNFNFPLTILINPARRIVARQLGLLTPAQILAKMGRADLTYLPPPPAPTFSLQSFDLELAYPESVLDYDGLQVRGSRAEPTAALGFTAGNLPAFFACDSTQRTSTPFRSTRSFTVGNFFQFQPRGTLTLPIELTVSNLQWNAVAPGVVDPFGATVEFRENSTGVRRRYAIPFVTTTASGVKVGRFSAADLDPALLGSFQYDQATLTLSWVRQLDPLLVLQTLEERLGALSLSTPVRRTLENLTRSARLACAPGSGPDKAVTKLKSLSRELTEQSGRQIDGVRARQFLDLAATARELLTLHPPTPPPASIPAFAGYEDSALARSRFRVGQLAPDFRAMSQHGPFRLGALRGKWVVLDFCTTWCSPCRAMAAETRGLVDFIHEQGIPFEYVSVLTENVDVEPATMQTAFDWALDYGVRSPIVTPLGLPSSQDALARHWRSYGLAASEFATQSNVFPVVVVIDPRGRIARISTGFTAPKQILQTIQRNDLTYVTSRPEFGLLDYEADVTYGTATAHYSRANLSQTDTVLSPEAGTTLPTLNAARYQPFGLGFTRQTTVLGFDYLSTTQPLVPIPHDTALSFSLKAPRWDAAGRGLLVPERTRFRAFNDATGDYYEFFLTAPTESPDGSVTSGPVTLAGLEVPADFPVTSVDFAFSWLRDDPDYLIAYLLRRLPDLALTKAQSTRLSVPAQGALTAWQVKHSPTTATARLQRFRTALQSLLPTLPDSTLAESLISVADTAIQQISAP